MRGYLLCGAAAIAAVVLLCARAGGAAETARPAALVQQSMVTGALPLLNCMKKKGTPALWPCIQDARLQKTNEADDVLKSGDGGKVLEKISRDLGFYIVDLYIADSNFDCRKNMKAKEKIHPACSPQRIAALLDVVSYGIDMTGMTEIDAVSLLGIKGPFISEMKETYGVR